MVSPLTEYSIPITCGHPYRSRQKPPPTLGEEVWCKTCRRWVVVLGNPWIIDCQLCRYTRSSGIVWEWAEQQARKHLIRYPSHVIQVYPRGYRDQAVTLVTRDIPMIGDGRYPY